MSKLKYTACQRVRFTACETLREGVIDFAVSYGTADNLYDIQDNHGRMYHEVPEVQVHGLAVVREPDDLEKAVLDFEGLIDQLRGTQL